MSTLYVASVSWDERVVALNVVMADITGYRPSHLRIINSLLLTHYTSFILHDFRASGAH